MTLTNRFALALAASVLSSALAFAPAAFAQDKGKTDTMSQGMKGKDNMKPKDAMSKDPMAKDGMGKDPMGKDSMKKDDMKK